MELLPQNLQAVEAHLKDLGWIESGDRIVSLEPAGEGNMNRTLRATLGNTSVILKQSVPFVAKYPDIPAPVERLDVEAAFYRLVKGKPALSARMPRLLGYDPAAKLVALTDLGPATDFSGLYDLADQPRALPSSVLLEWLATLHNTPIYDPQPFENMAMRALNHAHIFEIPLAPDGGPHGPRLDAQLSTARARLAADANLTTRAHALGRIYLGDTLDRSPDVLLHGDFYPGSWLAGSEGAVYVIDPEFAFVGSAEFDLGVFMAHQLMTGTQPSDFNALLDAYSRRSLIDETLLRAFAGMEIIRRLLGVAQLPLSASTERKLEWLDWAHQQVLA